jgi:hypothetical protein
MSCDDFSGALAEFVDGELDPARQRGLERHVEGCADCRALLADLKSIQAAAFTLDRVEPPAHVWAALRTAVAAEPAPITRGRLLAWPRSRRAWGVWLAAAAALLLATTAGIYPLLQDRAPQSNPPVADSEPPQVDSIASVQADFQAAEDYLERAIQGLERLTKTEGSELDPQVAAVLQKNMQTVDLAISETRAALKDQPGSADAQESLFGAMRTKVSLLQQTVELINEMRKGNQAEAGRLIQGLNQD